MSFMSKHSSKHDFDPTRQHFSAGSKKCAHGARARPCQERRIQPAARGRHTANSLAQRYGHIEASLLTDHAWLEIARTLSITRRELQIVQSVFDNQHEAKIAERFKISPHTVHMHLHRLFMKLNVTSRTELVLRIVEQMVTQAEYQSVMSDNPSDFTGNPHRPVDQVTWFEAVQYCQRLTTNEQAAGRLPAGWVYRLPTEAEWKYACRAGTTATFFHCVICSGCRPNSLANWLCALSPRSAASSTCVLNSALCRHHRARACGRARSGAF